MRKFYMLSIFIITSTFSDAQWVWQNPLPQGNSIDKIEMRSSTSGLAIAQSTILKTTNGGETWVPETNPYGYFNDFNFIDQNNGIATGSGKLLKTTNGGSSWSEIYNDSFVFIDYIDLNNIAAVKDNYVLRTTNGGSSWTKQYLNVGQEFYFSGIAFASPDLGIITGYNFNYDYGHYAGLIFRTTDGGKTWSEPQVEGIAIYTGVYMIDANIGILIGMDKIIKRTTDAGATWKSNVNGNYPDPDLLSISFSDNLNGIVTGNNGIVLTTSDAGLNWTQRSSGVSVGLSTVYFKNGLAVAGGWYGTILTSTNGGNSWTSRIMGTTKTLKAVEFTNMNNGLAAGYSGTITRTTNGGSSWLEITSGTSNHLNDIFSVNETVTYIAGAGGTILKTTDGGLTWNVQSTGTNKTLNSIHFISSTTGTAVGSDVTLRTTNGGSSWTVQQLNFNGSLLSVFFTDNNNGIISGTNGLILKTTNGGSSWEQQQSGTTAELRNVFLASPSIGYIVARGENNSNFILKTTNGGSGWTRIYSSGYNFNAIKFIDPYNGLAVGLRTFKTTNGGSSWTAIEGGLPGNIEDVAILDNKNGIFVGLGGAIMKYSNLGLNGSSGGSVPPADLAAYWKLDELSGSSYADVTGVNNGTGNVSPASVPGRVGQAQQFNGSTTRIDAAANPSLNFAANDDFSVEFWFKGNTIPPEYKIITGRHVNSSNRWYIGFKTGSGNIRFTMTSNGETFNMYGSNVINNEWHHVAVTRSGAFGETKIYVDGNLSTTYTKIVTGNISSSSAKLNIGNYTGNNVLNGIIDELAIHRAVLTPQVIQDHYNKGLSGKGYYESSGGSNTAPVITTSPVTNAVAGKLYSYDVNASGSPAPTFSLLTSPSGMTISSSSGLIQWTPASAGSFNVSVQAQNGVSPAAVQTFTVNVINEGTGIPGGLSAYWKLDESSGNNYADFTGVNNGTGNISPVSVTGRVGQAQQFNGSNSRIDVSAHPSFDFSANSNFTIEFWYKGSSIPADYKIITGRHINSSNRWYVGFKSYSGNVRFTMTSNGETFSMYGSNIINGSWHHVAVTRNGASGVTKVYVNGALSTSFTKVTTGNLSSPSVKLNIGNYAGNYVLDGTLDELAIHSVELSPAVILDHYNKGLAGQPYYNSSLPKEGNLTQVIPEEFELSQNYPNPFNPSTIIQYQLPEESKVRISIYNITGELIEEFSDEVQQAGYYEKKWYADNLSSGLYLLSFNAYSYRTGENYIKTVKMMLLK